MFLGALTAGAQEQLDENGLIVKPAEGQLKEYSRSGMVNVPVFFDYSQSAQLEGTVNIVYCADGTVYMQHIMSQTLKKYNDDIWIKGTYADGVLTFPSQPIGYSTYFRQHLNIAMGDFDTQTFGRAGSKACLDEPIVFKESSNGKLLELQNSSSAHPLGVYYDDGDYLDYWDYNTLLRDMSITHGDAATPPAGADVKEYIMSGGDAAMGPVNFMPKLVISGTDVWLGDFCFYAQGFWIKGSLQGQDLVFPSEQYITTNDLDDYTFYGLARNSNDAKPVDFVLHYDAETGSYSTDETDIFISRDLMQGNLDRMERVFRISLSPIPAVASEPQTEVPEGRMVEYYRNGKCTYSNGTFVQWLNQEDDESVIIIAYGEDGKTVWMQDPICMAENGAWVKGTIEADGLIHMPLFQWIQKDEDYGYLRTAVCERQSAGAGFTYNIAADIHEVTFSIADDGTVQLQPMGPNYDVTADPPTYLYSLVRATDLYWTGLSDASSTYVPTGDDNPVVNTRIDISTPVEGEEYNEYGILMKPGNGAERTYSRSGGNYSVSGEDVIRGTQEGYVHIVETEDGWVYMQKPISTYTKSFAATAWIKGRRMDDNTYRFPCSQPICYDFYYEATMSVCLSGGFDNVYGSFLPDRRSNIVFEISADGKTLTLAGTSADSPLACYYDDDDSWFGYGDFDTKLTFVSGGLVEETKTPADNLQRLPYLLKGYDVDEGPVVYKAQLAFDGEVAWMGSFSFWSEDLWVKGRREADGRLVFPMGQFLKNYQGYDLFFNGAYENRGGLSPCDFDLVYDAATDTYSTDKHMFISWYEISTQMNRAEDIYDITLEADPDPDTEGVIITGAPEGKLYYYKRTGGAFGYGDEPGPVYMFDQQASKQETVGITYAPDGRTVYMYNPISFAIPVGGSWVKGYMDEQGNLHFPVLQWVDYNHDFGYGQRTAILVRADNNSYVMLINVPEVVFELDPMTGVLSMEKLPGVDYSDPDNPNVIYGLVYSDNYEWSGYGDFNTVYYPQFEWKGIDDLTSIVDVDVNVDVNNMFDLYGRRISAPTKGLFISNGVKQIAR